MKRILSLFLGAILVSSCGFLRPDIMLKTPRNYVYSPIQDSVSVKESKITPNDILEFRLYSNDGFKLIDLTAVGGSVIANQGSILQYVIENDGSVKLPVLGEVKLSGLTVREAQKMLEEKYSAYYVKPFVLVKIVNKRVIIFPGSGGSARVLAISNNHTTIIEAIAMTGGLPEYSKSYKIKVIRGDPQKPTVYLLDLSTISGIVQANMIVQANDIIYVEPRIRVIVELTKELEPFLVLANSAFLAYTIYLETRH
jgi:polysaccharide export outer membrane protein